MTLPTITVGSQTFTVLFPDLIPPPSEEDLAGLRRSIGTRGVQVAVVVDESFGVIDGIHRLTIAEELGLDFVPFEVRHGLTHDQKRALARTLNRDRRHLTSEQKRQAVAAELKADPARSNRQVASEVGVHHETVAAVREQMQSTGEIRQLDRTTGRDGKSRPATRDYEAEKRKKLAELESAPAAAGQPQWQIITGDCLEVLPSLAPGSARLVFADPPYNIGVDYGQGEDADLLDPAEYMAWGRRWVEACYDLLAPDGSFFLLINDEYQHRYGCLIEDAGFTVRNLIKWYETFGVNCTNKYNRTSRVIYYAVKDPSRFVFNRREVSRPSDRQTKYNDPRANPDGKVLDDVWTDIPRLAGTHEERIPGFPTQLPLALLRRVVRAHSEEGDLVVDPFNGSGTTGAAALACGRRYVGVERSEEFAGRARQRLRAVQREFA